jgi:ABC-2 type transport system permease protein
MNKSLSTVWTFARINTKRFFRDKTALFFSVGFPLIFLFVFGGLNSNNGDISFKIALVNQSDSAFAEQYVQTVKSTDVLNIQEEISSLEGAKSKMDRFEIDATIVLPAGFGDVDPSTSLPMGKAELYYTQNNAQSAQALSGILEAQFKAINAQLVPSVTPFTVSLQEMSDTSMTAFDYSFAGLLGFAIIGMGIFGPINVFPELKKMGILRRLSTTPLKVWQYFLATVIGQGAIGVISFVAMFAVAILVFDLHVVGNWLELTFFLALSLAMILGIGLALGGWAKNERQVAPLANIIIFPMMFLSGTFFPRFLMPEWVQIISNFLPLTPVIDGIRLIATQGEHLIDILPQLGLVGAWFVVIYLIAFRVFRWE